MDWGAESGEEDDMAGNPDETDLWQAAQALNRAAAAVSPAASALPPLLFFTDPARTPRPWEVAARMPAGSGVVWRGFGRAEAGEEARRLRQVTAARGLVLLIGPDEGLAEAVEADGVHLPERDRGRAAELRRRHPRWILTGALHDPGAGPADTDRALDALILSPVFRAGGASATRPPLGAEGLAERVARLGLPVYGLGGITAGSVRALSGSGLCGVAAIEGVLEAYGPGPS